MPFDPREQAKLEMAGTPPASTFNPADAARADLALQSPDDERIKGIADATIDYALTEAWKRRMGMWGRKAGEGAITAVVGAVVPGLQLAKTLKDIVAPTEDEAEMRLYESIADRLIRSRNADEKGFLRGIGSAVGESWASPRQLRKWTPSMIALLVGGPAVQAGVAAVTGLLDMTDDKAFRDEVVRVKALQDAGGELTDKGYAVLTAAAAAGHPKSGGFGYTVGKMAMDMVPYMGVYGGASAGAAKALGLKAASGIGRKLATGLAAGVTATVANAGVMGRVFERMTPVVNYARVTDADGVIDALDKKGETDGMDFGTAFRREYGEDVVGNIFEAAGSLIPGGAFAVKAGEKGAQAAIKRVLAGALLGKFNGQKSAALKFAAEHGWNGVVGEIWLEEVPTMYLGPLVSGGEMGAAPWTKEFWKQVGTMTLGFAPSMLGFGATGMAQTSRAVFEAEKYLVDAEAASVGEPKAEKWWATITGETALKQVAAEKAALESKRDGGERPLVGGGVAKVEPVGLTDEEQTRLDVLDKATSPETAAAALGVKLGDRDDQRTVYRVPVLNADGEATAWRTYDNKEDADDQRGFFDAVLAGKGFQQQKAGTEDVEKFIEGKRAERQGAKPAAETPVAKPGADATPDGQPAATVKPDVETPTPKVEAVAGQPEATDEVSLLDQTAADLDAEMKGSVKGEGEAVSDGQPEGSAETGAETGGETTGKAIDAEIGQIASALADRGVSMRARFEGGRIVLASMSVPGESRGQGIGSAALSMLTAIADKYNVPIELVASDEYGTDIRDLRLFYEKAGFAATVEDEFAPEVPMTRQPRPAPTPGTQKPETGAETDVEYGDFVPERPQVAEVRVGDQVWFRPSKRNKVDKLGEVVNQRKDGDGKVTQVAVKYGTSTSWVDVGKVRVKLASVRLDEMELRSFTKPQRKAIRDKVKEFDALLFQHRDLLGVPETPEERGGFKRQMGKARSESKGQLRQAAFEALGLPVQHSASPVARARAVGALKKYVAANAEKLRADEVARQAEQAAQAQADRDNRMVDTMFPAPKRGAIGDQLTVVLPDGTRQTWGVRAFDPATQERLFGTIEEEPELKLVSGDKTLSEAFGGRIEAVTEVEMEPEFRQGGWHGTGVRGIKKFSLSHVGEGEGAQVFGWGLYFTDLKDIAKHYSRNLGNTEFLINKMPVRDYLVTQGFSGEEMDNAEELLARQAEAMVKRGDRVSRNAMHDALVDIIKGYPADRPLAEKVFDAIDRAWSFTQKRGGRVLYRVSLGRGDADLNWLDWDGVSNDAYDKIEKTFPPLVARITAEHGEVEWGRNGEKGLRPEWKSRLENLWSHVHGGGFMGRSGGQTVYRALSNLLGSQRAASEFLLRAGIDGIRYPAGTLSGMKDTGAKNYVVFDEDAITVEQQIQFRQAKKNPNQLSIGGEQSADNRRGTEESGRADRGVGRQGEAGQGEPRRPGEPGVREGDNPRNATPAETGVAETKAEYLARLKREADAEKQKAELRKQYPRMADSVDGGLLSLAEALDVVRLAEQVNERVPGFSGFATGLRWLSLDPLRLHNQLVRVFGATRAAKIEADFKVAALDGQPFYVPGTDVVAFHAGNLDRGVLRHEVPHARFDMLMPNERQAFVDELRLKGQQLLRGLTPNDLDALDARSMVDASADGWTNGFYRYNAKQNEAGSQGFEADKILSEAADRAGLTDMGIYAKRAVLFAMMADRAGQFNGKDAEVLTSEYVSYRAEENDEVLARLFPKAKAKYVAQGELDLPGKQETMFRQGRGPPADEAWQTRVTREMAAVKEVRDAQGRLLAPNGQPSRLNERQWKQTRTPSFAEFFGPWLTDPASASKVVDENGEPMVVYHGTAQDFEQFDGGMFVSLDPAYAGSFANLSRDMVGGTQRTIALFANVRRPLDLSSIRLNDRVGPDVITKKLVEYGVPLADIQDWMQQEGLSGNATSWNWTRHHLVDKLREWGIDGVMLTEYDSFTQHSIATFYVTDAVQVKSATANRGTFSPADPNILRSQSSIPAKAFDSLVAHAKLAQAKGQDFDAWRAAVAAHNQTVVDRFGGRMFDVWRRASAEQARGLAVVPERGAEVWVKAPNGEWVRARVVGWNDAVTPAPLDEAAVIEKARELAVEPSQKVDPTLNPELIAAARRELRKTQERSVTVEVLGGAQKGVRESPQGQIEGATRFEQTKMPGRFSIPLRVLSERMRSLNSWDKPTQVTPQPADLGPQEKVLVVALDGGITVTQGFRGYLDNLDQKQLRKLAKENDYVQAAFTRLPTANDARRFEDNLIDARVEAKAKYDTDRVALSGKTAIDAGIITPYDFEMILAANGYEPNLRHPADDQNPNGWPMDAKTADIIVAEIIDAQPAARRDLAAALTEASQAQLLTKNQDRIDNLLTALRTNDLADEVLKRYEAIDDKANSADADSVPYRMVERVRQALRQQAGIPVSMLPAETITRLAADVRRIVKMNEDFIVAVNRGKLRRFTELTGGVNRVVTINFPKDLSEKGIKPSSGFGKAFIEGNLTLRSLFSVIAAGTDLDELVNMGMATEDEAKASRIVREACSLVESVATANNITEQIFESWRQSNATIPDWLRDFVYFTVGRKRGIKVLRQVLEQRVPVDWGEAIPMSGTRSLSVTEYVGDKYAVREVDGKFEVYAERGEGTVATYKTRKEAQGRVAMLMPQKDMVVKSVQLAMADKLEIYALWKRRYSHDELLRRAQRGIGDWQVAPSMAEHAGRALKFGREDIKRIIDSIPQNFRDFYDNGLMPAKRMVFPLMAKAYEQQHGTSLQQDEWYHPTHRMFSGYDVQSDPAVSIRQQRYDTFMDNRSYVLPIESNDRPFSIKDGILNSTFRYLKFGADYGAKTENATAVMRVMAELRSPEGVLMKSIPNANTLLDEMDQLMTHYMHGPVGDPDNARMVRLVMERISVLALPMKPHVVASQGLSILAVPNAARESGRNLEFYDHRAVRHWRKGSHVIEQAMAQSVFIADRKSGRTHMSDIQTPNGYEADPIAEFLGKQDARYWWPIRKMDGLVVDFALRSAEADVYETEWRKFQAKGYYVQQDKDGSWAIYDTDKLFQWRGASRNEAVDGFVDFAWERPQGSTEKLRDRILPIAESIIRRSQAGSSAFDIPFIALKAKTNLFWTGVTAFSSEKFKQLNSWYREALRYKRLPPEEKTLSELFRFFLSTVNLMLLPAILYYINQQAWKALYRGFKPDDKPTSKLGHGINMALSVLSNLGAPGVFAAALAGVVLDVAFRNQGINASEVDDVVGGLLKTAGRALSGVTRFAMDPNLSDRKKRNAMIRTINSVVQLAGFAFKAPLGFTNIIAEGLTADRRTPAVRGLSSLISERRGISSQFHDIQVAQGLDAAWRWFHQSGELDDFQSRHVALLGKKWKGPTPLNLDEVRRKAGLTEEQLLRERLMGKGSSGDNLNLGGGSSSSDGGGLNLGH